MASDSMPPMSPAMMYGRRRPSLERVRSLRIPMIGAATSGATAPMPVM
jgi:hypothetical protein